MSEEVHVIGIATCDRPDFLDRCVNSFAANATANKLRIEFVVADGSSDVVTRNSNKETLRRARDKHRVRIRYVGNREAQAFLPKAINSGIEEKVVRFAIGSGGSGSLKNLIMLDAAGVVTVLVDDDVLCETDPCPDKKDSVRIRQRPGKDFLQLTYGIDPTFFWFDGVWKSQSARGTRDFNILGEMAECIGTRLKDGAVVRAVQPGISGQIKGKTLTYSLLGSQMTHINLNRTDDGYEEVVSSKTGMRCVNEIVFSRSCYLVPHLICADNRDPLPPFYPAPDASDGIGEASLFGYMLEAWGSDAVSAHVPWAVKRQGIAPLPGSESNHWLGTSFHDVCLRVLLNAAGAGATAIGGEFVRIGSLPEDEFDRFLSDGANAQRSALLEFTTQRSNNATRATAGWIRDVQALADERRKPTLSVPYDFRQNGESVSEAKDMTREALVMYGKLIMSWSAMFKAAKTMRSNQIRISISI